MAHTKYKIVSAESLEKLEAKINVLIKDGWQAQGGVQTQLISRRSILLQALVS